MVKRGFSLAEALIVMAIISIFFGAAAKVSSAREKVKKQTNPHGYYECYETGANQYEQRTVTDGIASDPIEVPQCRFIPPNGVSFYSINTYNAGHYSAMEPNINNELIITFNQDSVTFTSIKTGQSYTTPVVENPNGQENDNTNFFRTSYPESGIYNNGNLRTGILINW